MQFNKIQVITAMQQTAVVPIFYNSDIEIAKNTVKACYEGGIRVIEFTNRGDFAHEVFGELVKFARQSCPNLIIGVGSIVDAPTAALYIQLGACFIVSPLFNADIAKLANRRSIPYIPGCGSITEVGNAQEAGCDVCKLFPADVLGADFVKALKAPMPWTNLMITGGVKPEESNLRMWFDAGATCVGMGSNLLPPAMLIEGNWTGIKELARKTLAIVEKIKH